MDTIQTISMPRIPRARRSSKYDMPIAQALELNPGDGLWLMVMPRIRPIYDRRFRFGSHNLEFHTIHHTIPDGVKLIVPVSNVRLRNLKLAISRRISQLGYADKLKVIIRSRKLIIIRI